MSTRSKQLAEPVTIRDVTVHRGGATALGNVSMTWHPGRVTALVGPNGAGKSTVLAAAAGLLPITSGQILHGDSPLNPADIASVLQSVSPGPHLPLTVAEVVAMGRYPRRGILGRFKTEDREVIAHSIERVGLADLADRRFGELSGGQRQRTLVAQGLSQQAPILLLDEPNQALDPPSRELIGSALLDEAQRGVVVVVSTHDLGDANRADDTVLLDGTVVAEGPSAEVLTDENLVTVYRGRLLRLADGLVVLEDPGHHHGPDDQHLHEDGPAHI